MRESGENLSEGCHPAFIYTFLYIYIFEYFRVSRETSENKLPSLVNFMIYIMNKSSIIFPMEFVIIIEVYGSVKDN